MNADLQRGRPARFLRRKWFAGDSRGSCEVCQRSRLGTLSATNPCGRRHPWPTSARKPRSPPGASSTLETRGERLKNRGIKWAANKMPPSATLQELLRFFGQRVIEFVRVFAVVDDDVHLSGDAGELAGAGIGNYDNREIGSSAGHHADVTKKKRT